MNEEMNNDMAMEVTATNRRTWIVRITLVAFIMSALTLGCLLFFGISPAGRYLQSVDLVRDSAKLFCS